METIDNKMIIGEDKSPVTPWEIFTFYREIPGASNSTIVRGYNSLDENGKECFVVDGEYSFKRVAYSKYSARKIAYDHVINDAKHMIKTDERFSNFIIEDTTELAEKE